MTQPTQTPVIASTDDTASDAKPTNAINSTLSFQKLFNTPPKWSFVILKFLIVVLIPLLSNAPAINLNFYMITIML